MLLIVIGWCCFGLAYRHGREPEKIKQTANVLGGRFSIIFASRAARPVHCIAGLTFSAVLDRTAIRTRDCRVDLLPSRELGEGDDTQPDDTVVRGSLLLCLHIAGAGVFTHVRSVVIGPFEYDRLAAQRAG